MTLAALLAPVPCNACRELRKKCGRELPHCHRCTKRGASCAYRTTGGLAAPSPDSTSPSPGARAQLPPEPLSATALSPHLAAVTIAIDALESTIASARASIAAPLPASGPSKGPPSSSPASRQRLSIACEICKTSKRKCDAVRPACARCVERGSTCVYIAYPSQDLAVTPQDLRKAASDIQSIVQRLNDLQGFIAHVLADSDFDLDESYETYEDTTPLSETLMNVEELNVPMDVESVDVFASIEDYFCVQAFLSNISQPTMFLLDPQEFLDSFFTEPADLRLTMCAVSAALQTPRLPRTVCDNYYKRAMTAFSRSLDNPTLKTLQALMLMNTYVTMNGQPHLARNNFFTAVTFVEKLSLDVDPDDLELRTGVPIPPKEKYERRYWYHVMKYYLKIIKAVHSRNVLLDFRKGGPFVEFISHSVKLPVHPDSGVINDIYYAANIQELVSKAAALHKSMPMSIVDIIDSQPAALLRANLTALQLETPRGLIIHTPADLYVATTTYTPCNLVASLLASLHFHTVPCLLHRAKLYLTAFLPIDSAHLQRTGARETTLRALCDSVQSARMIAALNSWMALSAPPGLRKVFWRNHIFPCFCLFEAAVVLWFVTCKTREEWLAAAGDVGGLEWRREVRSGVMDVGRTLEELEGLLAGGPGGSENMMSPLVQCVLGMVAEMEKVEEAVSKGEGIPPVAVAGVGACSWEAGVNFVALGMKVMSIVEDDRVKPFVSDPWTFLGLMGVPVGGNLVWKAYYEDEWSFFWELVVNGRM